MKRTALVLCFSALLWSCSDDNGTNSNGSDPVAPQVVSTTPASGATGVSRDVSLQATFSRDMDPGTITSATFTLSGGVTGVVTYNDKTAVFDPVATLDAGTAYTATISTAAKDQTGTPLANSYTWSFTTATSPTNTVMDIDGNVYQTVTIGTQVWMKENLRVTHYRNGDAIPRKGNSTDWTNYFLGAFCEYNNNIADATTYGRLYNWYAVHDTRNIAPAGWHVATDDDWKQLETFLGMSQSEADRMGARGTDQGGKLKEPGTAHWASPNTGATNESGFTALPAGNRTSTGEFLGLGYSANFWTSSQDSGQNPITRSLGYTSLLVSRGIGVGTSGYSVRCVKD